MEQAAVEQVQRQISEEAAKRFPGVAQQVKVLQYGDDPVIEPGELMVLVILEAAEGEEAQEEALQAFERTHGKAV